MHTLMHQLSIKGFPWSYTSPHVDYSYGLCGVCLCSTTEVNLSDIITSLEEVSRQPLLQRQRCKKSTQGKGDSCSCSLWHGRAQREGMPPALVQAEGEKQGCNSQEKKRRKKQKQKTGQKETAHSKICDDAMHELEHCLYPVYFKT